MRGQGSRRTRLTPPSGRRTCICKALAGCPTGEWIAIEDLSRALRIWKLDFPVEQTTRSNLYVGESLQFGWLGYEGTDYFSLVQGQYVLVVLWEYAAAFGAVDLLYTAPQEAQYPVRTAYEFYGDCFSRYDGLKHFRINALGAYLLGIAPEYAGPRPGEEPPAFTVLPNLDVVVTNPHRLAPNDRALLERAASCESEGVYRLDRERILTALEEGLTLDALSGFLERRGANGLPQTVARLFEDLGANTGVLGAPSRALLVPCHDPHVRELVIHDCILGKLCLPAGNDHLAVREEDEAAFRRRLKKLGYAMPGK